MRPRGTVTPLHLLIDADAFNALRSLGLLEDLMGLARQGAIRLSLTEYIARFELNDLQGLLQKLQSEQVVKIIPVPLSSEAGRYYRQLRKQPPRTRSGKSVHKGEQEAVAWAHKEAPEVLFISCDAGARDLAEEHGVRSGDVLSLVCELLEAGHLRREVAEQRLAPWEGRHSGQCVPKGYAGLEDALARWRRPRG